MKTSPLAEVHWTPRQNITGFKITHKKPLLISLYVFFWICMYVLWPVWGKCQQMCSTSYPLLCTKSPLRVAPSNSKSPSVFLTVSVD